ncbi:cory-CC-star protein [Aquifex aeolicus]|uniref:cory-CC-star protein n=1 Tax=Aquifex aeolicus TaxID=63363 RepID=UPI00030F22E4|nr:cory-CC-star protein [Aquifex aeolicus]
MNLREVLKEFYRLKFGQEFGREAQKLEEVFIFLLFADYFGLSTPLKFYLIELYPELVEEFHKWHKKLGLVNSPLDWIKCC